MTGNITKDPLYKRWQAMKNRCKNENLSAYKNYGGRGISVCDEWTINFHGYKKFVLSLPNAMEDGYTLDRIDNDGNYEPNNMRWATIVEQQANRRNSYHNRWSIDELSDMGEYIARFKPTFRAMYKLFKTGDNGINFILNTTDNKRGLVNG